MKRHLLFLFACVLSFNLSQAQFSVQKVIIEEFTGAWCGYCPEGGSIMETILQNNNKAIGVSLHNGDAMVFTEGDQIVSFYNDGFPSATFNRDGQGIGRNLWASRANTHTQGAGSVTISFDSLDYNSGTREVYVRIKANFTGPETGDMRFNLFVTEDNVDQTGAGYDQTNYFDGNPGHEFYQAGNPIVGYNHRHVARAALGGAWGTAGIIDATVNFGSNFTHVYTYTLPASYDENEIHLVAAVQRFDGNTPSDREIMNGEEMPLITATAMNNPGEDGQFMEIYPNPTSARTTIAFNVKEMGNVKVEILNNMGQHVSTLAEGILGSGAHTVYWNGADQGGHAVANGVYMVRLITENGQSSTQRLMLAR